MFYLLLLGDKWGSLLRSVIGQSRTSLNTISEDDKRNSWVRGMMKMTRSGSVSTLPDLGSWSVRNSYAEPILNIITNDIESVQADDTASGEDSSVKSVGIINNGRHDKNMDVILEQSGDQTPEDNSSYVRQTSGTFINRGQIETNPEDPIYDTADGGAEVTQGTDSDTASDASASRKSSDIQIEMRSINTSGNSSNSKKDNVLPYGHTSKPVLTNTPSQESGGDTQL